MASYNWSPNIQPNVNTNEDANGTYNMPPTSLDAWLSGPYPDNYNPAPSTDPDPATWNSENGETSTGSVVSALVSAGQEGVPWSAVDGTNPTPGLNVAQTTPPPTTGGNEQEGAPALTQAQIKAAQATNFSMNFQVNLG
jgi:hypothetical protein